MNKPAEENLNTYMDLYEEGKKRLSAVRIREYEIDARYLLLFVFGIDMNEMLMNYAVPFRADQVPFVRKYLDAVAEREKRIPLQHITHTQNFFGYDFLVNDKVLIPRQDTEILVEEVLKDLKSAAPESLSGQSGNDTTLLDLCTGSGCIAVALKKEAPFLCVTAGDISEEALAVAEKNAAENKAEIRFLKSDMYGAFADEKFDIITCNPPYIRSSVIEMLEPEVKDHEPRLALDAEEDGLKFYRILAAETPKHLEEGGRIYFEIGFDEAKDVTAMLRQSGFQDTEVIRDYAGLDRVIKAHI